MRYTLRQHRTDSASISAKPHGRNYAVLPSISFVFLRVIGACRGISAVTCPVGMEKLTARRVQPLVGVRAEVIPLRLKQIRGQAVGGIAVEVRKRRRHCGRGHAVLHGCCRDLPPRREQRLHRALEIRVEQEVAKVGILVIRVLDLPEEHRTDDLTAYTKQCETDVWLWVLEMVQKIGEKKYSENISTSLECVSGGATFRADYTL